MAMPLDSRQWLDAQIVKNATVPDKWPFVYDIPEEFTIFTKILWSFSTRFSLMRRYNDSDFVTLLQNEIKATIQQIPELNHDPS